MVRKEHFLIRMGWGGALELVESIVLTVLPKRVQKKNDTNALFFR